MNHYLTLCTSAVLSLASGLAIATGPTEKEARKANTAMTANAEEACKTRAAGVERNTCVKEHMAGHTTGHSPSKEEMKKDAMKKDAMKKDGMKN